MTLALMSLAIAIYVMINTKNYRQNLNYEVFVWNLIPQLIVCVYAIMFSATLVSLVGYHFTLIGSNETTQEEMRGKYKKWGGNPYDFGKWRAENLKYFFRRQDSLVFSSAQTTLDIVEGDSEGGPRRQLYNQHVLDSLLIHFIEVEDPNYGDDMKSMKSMKSFKSRGSIKSEHFGSIKNDDDSKDESSQL